MDDCIGQGDSIEFLVKISAERDKCHAPFELHFPFLSNSSAKPQMAICDYKVIKIGRNFPCLAEDDIHPIETMYVISRDLFYKVFAPFPTSMYFRLLVNCKSKIICRMRISLKFYTL